MNRRDLVLAALNHEESTPVPHHVEFTWQALEQMQEYTGDPDIEAKLGSCLNYVQYWGWPTEMPDRPGHFKDEFGVIWNRTGIDRDIGNVIEPQIEDPEDTDYEFPVCDTDRLRRDIEGLLAQRGDRFTFMGFGFSLYERVWSLTGMENALISMAAAPEALEELFDRVCEFYLPLIDIALEYDIDGVYFGDDWGQQHGLLMGPDHWRRFIKPRLARYYERVKSKGLYVLQHSCGDVSAIFDDLVEIGLDCYQTFQPEVYDIADMKRRYGDKVTFWGSVSTQQALPFLSPDEVKAFTVEKIKILSPGGGLIIAPTHALTPDIPPENILAMSDVFLHQDQYL